MPCKERTLDFHQLHEVLLGWRNLVLHFIDGQPFRRVHAYPALEPVLSSGHRPPVTGDPTIKLRAAVGHSFMDVVLTVHNYIPVHGKSDRLSAKGRKVSSRSTGVSHPCTVQGSRAYALAQAARQGRGCSPQVPVQAWHVL